MSNPKDAMSIIKKKGIGISNSDLMQIPFSPKFYTYKQKSPNDNIEIGSSTIKLTEVKFAQKIKTIDREHCDTPNLSAEKNYKFIILTLEFVSPTNFIDFIPFNFNNITVSDKSGKIYGIRYSSPITTKHDGGFALSLAELDEVMKEANGWRFAISVPNNASDLSIGIKNQDTGEINILKVNQLGEIVTQKIFDTIDLINQPTLSYYTFSNVEGDRWLKCSYTNRSCKNNRWPENICNKLYRGEYWIGMTYEMLKASKGGEPDSANRSNYGRYESVQWCWMDSFSPHCFYDDNEDGKIDSYN
jgi:hypothetical protein